MANAQLLSLTELTNLLPRLQATIESLQRLSGEQLGAGRVGTRKAVAARSVLHSKYSRADGERLRDRILTALSGTQAKVGVLAADLGAPIEAVRYHLKVLRDEKKVGMKGSRATAEWFQRK